MIPPSLRPLSKIMIGPLERTVRYDSVKMLKKMAFYSPRLQRTMAQALLSGNFEQLSIFLVNGTTIQIYFSGVENPISS